MRDRIEISQMVYNVYTDYTRDGQEAISVIFTENKNCCNILSYCKIKINNSGDTTMKLSSLHNNFLKKLFKALRKDQNNPKIESNDEVLQSSNDDFKNTNTTYDIHGNDLRNEVFRYWSEYCHENLPEEFVACFILDDSNMEIFNREEIPKENIKIPEAINKLTRTNREKLEASLGATREIIIYDSEYNYFYLPLLEDISIASVSKNGPIGIHLKKIEKFKNTLLKEIK